MAGKERLSGLPFCKKIYERPSGIVRAMHVNEKAQEGVWASRHF